MQAHTSGFSYQTKIYRTCAIKCPYADLDAIPLVTALYPISVARAQSTFLTASEKARQVIGYCCLETRPSGTQTIKKNRFETKWRRIRAKREQRIPNIRFRRH